MRMLGGFITAAALVLPGISASHMLYMLGIYDDVMQSIATLNLLPLIPMALGLALGVFLTAKLVDTLMSRHSQGAYLIILGFMFGSLVELIPECDHPLQYLIGVICTACGFFLVKILSSKEQAKDEQSAHSKADK